MLILPVTWSGRLLFTNLPLEESTIADTMSLFSSNLCTTMAVAKFSVASGRCHTFYVRIWLALEYAMNYVTGKLPCFRLIIEIALDGSQCLHAVCIFLMYKIRPLVLYLLILHNHTEQPIWKWTGIWKYCAIFLQCSLRFRIYDSLNI